jgi:hypothetical protein
MSGQAVTEDLQSISPKYCSVSKFVTSDIRDLDLLW